MFFLILSVMLIKECIFFNLINYCWCNFDKVRREEFMSILIFVNRIILLSMVILVILIIELEKLL